MGILNAIASTGTTKQSSGGSNVGTSGTSLATDFNSFLTLLTTQLKNQDPTNPVDSNQFTQQLVEFAGVQQQLNTNTLLQQLVTNSQTGQVGMASSFIGTVIQATGNQGALTSGQGLFGYSLSGPASSVKVTIKDASGNVVFNGTGPTASGNNLVTWNGKNSFTGVQEPDGVYSISVTATTASGTPVTATPYTTGTVSSASISNGSVLLDIGKLQIPESNVTNITNLPGASAKTSTPTPLAAG